MRLVIVPHLKSRKMTASALADAVGVQKGFLSEIISGNKQPSYETLCRIIEALGVAPGEVLVGDGRALTGEIEPATAPPEATRLPSSSGNLSPVSDEAVRAIAPWARQPVQFELALGFPSLGLLRGDILIVDIGVSPEPGDITIVTEWQGGSHGPTRLRRYLPPFYVSSEAGEDEPVLQQSRDGQQYGHHGKVIAMIRPKIAA